MKTFIALFLAALCVLQTRAIRATPTPQTRDSWRSVRTNNLLVIGNADAEKLRQVAAWLEFFHSSFARLVSRNVLNSSVPTTVIIFRDDASFIPFKPLYQGRPANLSGFFQPGDDVNYIALSLDSGDRDPYSTAFHEYVHLHLRDNVPNTPLWLNEGLAELYGSLQFAGNEALLGTPLAHYIRILRDSELLPLKTLFSIGTNSPHYNEQDKTGIFYGESWALVHYLMLGDHGRQEQFKRFLQQVSRGEDAGKAIEDSFGVTLAKLEEDLRAYIRRGDFTAQRIASVDDPQTYASYTAMQRSSLTDSEANYYLGDLLLHIGRDTDAERYFKQSIALDPGFIPAYASLGLLCVYQHRYADAKKYLAKATTSTQTYLVHYLYAFVLSREGISADGTVSEYSAENARLIREQLQQAIKLAPSHAPSYHLLAVVDYIRNEQLDEAFNAAQKAHQLAPANENYAELVQRLQVRSREPIKSAAIAEPAKTGTSRMLGGGGATSINDGRTIAQSGSLPTADELIAKYIDAVGGVAAYKAKTSRIVKGTIDVIGVSRGESVVMYAQAPNKVLYVNETQSEGTIKRGFNGRTGWERTTAGLRILKNRELELAREDTDFYAFLKMGSLYKKITMVGMSKIGYRDVYVIEGQLPSGTSDRIYFDAQSFLVVRINKVMWFGTVYGEAETYLDDWREVEGLKTPFRLTVSYPKLTISLTVNEIKYNVPIDASIFEP